MKNLNDIEFWSTEGVNWYRWPTGPVYHEGEENVNAMVKFVGDQTVRDIGCGYGRLATKFKPEKYTGYDVCASATNKGTRMFPGYKFVHWKHEPLLPAEATLVVSVAKCVDDQDIAEFLALVCANTNTLILAEILGAMHSGPPDYSVYPRTVETYKQLLAHEGFVFVDSFTSPHVHIDLPFTVTYWKRQ